MSHKILIIIPAYNEQSNICKVIEEIKALKREEVFFLVVDDGSMDKTADEVRKLEGWVISHPFNLGIGGAVQTGFKFAWENGFDFAVQVDGDGQHDVNFLDVLIKPVIEGQVDMSIGSRFLPPYEGYRSSFIRRIGISFFSKLISFLTQYKVTDPTSGFRCINRKLIQIFSESYPQDFPEPEAIVIAGRSKSKIKEVPVIMRKRMAGHSSIRYLKTLYYMIKVTFAILLRLVF